MDKIAFSCLIAFRVLSAGTNQSADQTEDEPRWTGRRFIKGSDGQRVCAAESPAHLKLSLTHSNWCNCAKPLTRRALLWENERLEGAPTPDGANWQRREISVALQQHRARTQAEQELLKAGAHRLLSV